MLPVMTILRRQVTDPLDEAIGLKPVPGKPRILELFGTFFGICKLDIDANEETPPKYGIRGIPTLMLFKNGAVEATKVGALSKSQLTAFLDSNI